MTERQDDRDEAQDRRGAAQDERELTQSEWITEQKKLIEAQTENITALVGAVETLAGGLSKRPTLGKVIVLVAVMSMLSNAITVGTVLWVRSEIVSNQEQSATRGKEILSLTTKVDDCLDTTVDDGDPIGKCAAESQARFTYAVSQVTANVTCAQQKFYLDLIAANPEAGLTPPPPRPECDADGS